MRWSPIFSAAYTTPEQMQRQQHKNAPLTRTMAKVVIPEFLNALLPMVRSEAGKLTLFNVEQPENAEPGRTVTPAGTVACPAPSIA